MAAVTRCNAPRLVIHAGFHKTGTTSIQAALQAHASQLSAHMAVQVLAGGPSALRDAAQAARQYSARPGGVTLRRLRLMLRLWAEGLALDPGQGLLLSSEDFAGHMPGNRGVQSYAAAPAIAATLAEALRQRFPAAEVRFVCTTRAPAAWLRSVHWQLAKHHHMTLDAAEFARLYAPAARMAPVLTALRQATNAPLHIAPLEAQALRRLGPVAALYDAAGLPPQLCAALPALAAANTAPPGDLAQAFVALNRQDMSAEARQAAKAALLHPARNPVCLPPAPR